MGASLGMVLKEFIDPLRQTDHIPLSPVVNAVGRQYPHMGMGHTQAPEFLQGPEVATKAQDLPWIREHGADDTGDRAIHLQAGGPGRNLRQENIPHNDRLFAQYDRKTVHAVTRQVCGDDTGTQAH